MAGILYLVATPIGNLGDFTPRAVETLENADFIAAEDTRVSMKLLNHFGVKKSLISYHEHNHVTAGQSVLNRLLAGESCALMTDAGTPAISDPGEDLVRLCAENGVEVRGKRLVVLSAGGAVTAICVQAALGGAAEIAIFNRDDEFFASGRHTVEKLAQAVPGCKASITPLEDGAALADAVRHCDILVNATRVGMKPLDGETLVDPALFRADLVVADTVYNPRETRMIREARAAGCQAAVGGIGMLLWQGVAAFKLFTGKDMPTQEVLEKFLS